MSELLWKVGRFYGHKVFLPQKVNPEDSLLSLGNLVACCVGKKFFSKSYLYHFSH